MSLTVSVTTRGRYYSTLSLCLTSILTQSLLPNEIILVDDNEKKEFYNIQIYKDILKIIKNKNIKFSYYYGSSKGQVYAQQIALENCKTEYLYKMDDDNILEYNTLEILYNTIKNNPDIGAVSGLILNNSDINRELKYKSNIYNKIEDLYTEFNIQMCGKQDDNIKKVEHIYSNFLFKVNIADKYSLDFSPSGHREDTVFTYEIYLKGYDLLINPKAIIWHIINSEGGNRIHSANNENEIKFLKKLKEWNIIPNKLKIEENDEIIFTKKNDIEYLIYKKI